MAASDESARADTTRIRVGAISVAVPAHLLASTGEPIDSSAAVLTGGGITVIIDQSPFADRMESSIGQPGRREEPVHIAGATGRIVSFRTPEDRTYTVAAVLSEPVPATVVVRADDSVPERDARRIVESLQPVTPTGRNEGEGQDE